MKTKFTPAPWYVQTEVSRDRDDQWMRWDIFSESSPLCVMQTSRCGQEDYLDHNEVEANVNLVVKAPELFNALKALVESMDGAMCGHKEELKNAKKILKEVGNGK